MCPIRIAFETSKWLSAVIITVKPRALDTVYNNETSILRTGYLVPEKPELLCSLPLLYRHLHKTGSES